MAAPAASAGVSGMAFDLHLDGRPDLKDSAAVLSLPAHPLVLLTELDHRLIKATPCLDWVDIPGAAPTDPPRAKAFSLSYLTLLCTIGGVGTPWLAAQSNVLLLSHVPSHANDMWHTWVAVGGLSLDRVYDTIPKLANAVMMAKLACGDDNRLSLVQDAFFSDEARPAVGAGSAVDRNWMYCFSGAMLLGADVMETRAVAYLRHAVEPKDKSLGRDLAGDNYCRMLASLRRMTESRSASVAAAFLDPLIPPDEISEYIADMWVQMVGTGYPFLLNGRIPQRNKEIGMADSLLHGADAEKEATFKKMIADAVSDTRLVRKCVDDGSGCQTSFSLAANFEQLANEVLPGVKWCSMHCIGAVEHELTVLKLESLLDSWGGSPLELLSSLRSHLKQERGAVEASNKLKSGDSADDDRGLASASGIEARKLPVFLETKRSMVGCKNFMEGLDGMLRSQSKPWYMKAVRKLMLSSQNIPEMESSSKFLEKWHHYWPMAISRGESGEVQSDVQGKEFPEDQVVLLLRGEWHLVDWVKLVRLVEFWTDNVAPDEGTFQGTFANLHGVKSLLFKTMKLLRVARDGESEDSVTTCTGFMNKIITLERRSRGIPKRTPARRQAVQNMIDVMNQGLKEFGSRWADQFVKPVNYMEPLITSFADKHCFVMLRFDELDKVADDLHGLAKVLPLLFEGGTFKVNEEQDHGRFGGLREEPLSQGGCHQ